MYKKEQYISNNGEIIKTKISAYKDKFDDDKGYFFYSNGSTINGKAGVPFPKELTRLEIGGLAILSRFLLGSSNMLGYRGNENVIKAMTVSDFAEILDISDRQAYRFFNKMNKYSMIAKVTISTGDSTVVQYYMNPIYFLNGRNINLNLYLMFQHQIDEHIPGWAQERFKELKQVKRLEERKE